MFKLVDITLKINNLIIKNNNFYCQEKIWKMKQGS